MGVAVNFRGVLLRSYFIRVSRSLFWVRGLCEMWIMQTNQRVLILRAKVAIWKTVAYYSRCLATC